MNGAMSTTPCRLQVGIIERSLRVLQLAVCCFCGVRARLSTTFERLSSRDENIRRVTRQFSSPREEKAIVPRTRSVRFSARMEICLPRSSSSFIFN